MTAQIISRQVRQSVSVSVLRALLLALAVLVLLGVVYTSQSTQATVTGQRVQSLNDQVTRYDREIDQLKYDIAVLSAPARIAEIARSRGLAPAPITRTVYLSVRSLPVVPPAPRAVNSPDALPAEPAFLVTLWNEFLDWVGLAGAASAQAGQ